MIFSDYLEKHGVDPQKTVLVRHPYSQAVVKYLYEGDYLDLSGFTEHADMSEQELRSHRCCFTGHRPEKLKRAETEIKKGLEGAILKAIHEGFTTFITGMARGVDIWAGQIVLRLRQDNPDLRLIAALPYPGCDRRWSASWRRQYAEVLEAADLVKGSMLQFRTES